MSKSLISILESGFCIFVFKCFISKLNLESINDIYEKDLNKLKTFLHTYISINAVNLFNLFLGYVICILLKFTKKEENTTI